MPNDILRREAERLRNLSESCAQQGDYSTARQLLKMVIEIEESDILVTKEALAADFHELGWICYLLDAKQEAQQYLQLALDLRLSSVQQNHRHTQETAELLTKVMADMGIVKPNIDCRTSH